MESGSDVLLSTVSSINTESVVGKVLEVLEVLEKIVLLEDFRSMDCFAVTTLPNQESII